MAKNSSDRIRAVMIVQPVELLKYTIEEIKGKVKEEAKQRKNFEWALIIHNQDRSKTDPTKLAKPHIHLIMRCGRGSGIRLEKWAEMIDVPVNQVQKWDKHWSNAVAYTVHQTTGSADKFQYPIDELEANFDVASVLDKGKKASTMNKRNAVKMALEKLDAGVGDYHELADSLLGEDKVHFLRKAKDIMNYQATQPKPLQPLEVYYIYGKAGSGKTRLAKALSDEDLYITSSQKDPFGKYGNQTNILIDDIRKRMFEPDDLLRILDQYNEMRMGPARYSDKDLRGVTKIYITNIQDPLNFWKNSYFGEPYAQFARRLTDVYEVSTDGQTFTVESTGDVKALPWTIGGTND